MRFVMVPVPSEHVLEVMRMVLFRAPPEDDPGGQRDEVTLRLFVDGADELTRSLLDLVALAVTRDRPLRLSDAAEQLDVAHDLVRRLVRDVNRLFGGRELIRVASEPTVGVHGKKGAVMYLQMRPEHAKVVRQRASQAAPPGG